MTALPAPPGQRMAYDRDGTVPFGGADGFAPDGPGGTYVTYTNSENAGPVDEQGPCELTAIDSGSFIVYYGLIFPEPRDVTGVFWQVNPHDFDASFIETSVDTTDGTDGTWVQQTTTDPDQSFNPITNRYGDTVIPYYRTEIVDLTDAALTGIVGIRMFAQSSFGKFVQTLHVYGQPSTGENPDSLRFWQSGTDAEVGGGYFDFGDTVGGSNYTIEFRLKNISSTYTAAGVVISCETLTDASPTLIPQFLLSLDGSTYAESITVGDIAPGTTTGTLYIQAQVTSGAQIGACELRMVALPSSWT